MYALISLLAVYASVATSALTYKYAFTNKYPFLPGDDIDNALTVATRLYNAVYKEGTVPDLEFHVVYNPKQMDISARRSTKTLTFGSDDSYWHTYQIIHQLGHLLGVGGTTRWKSDCVDGTLYHFPQTQTLLHDLDPKALAVIYCNGYSFKPHGMNHPDEYNDSDAVIHIRLVLSMINEGLRDGLTSTTSEEITSKNE